MMIPRRSALEVLGGLGALGALRGLGLSSNDSLTLGDGKAGVSEQSRSLRIGVIGSGSLGGTVGRLLVQAGHEVLFSSRHPEELLPMTRALGARATAGTTAQAAGYGSVVLIAVPYSALPDLGRDLRDAWRGKIVLDASNDSPNQADPVGRDALAKGLGLASAEHLPGTRLVRAFSAVDASAVAASAGRRTGKLGVPIAGDDKEALDVAAQLVRDTGCEPLVVGNLATARRFQRGTPAFRANTTLAELRRLIDTASPR
jgi:predicted dinucleotide-binding enzyme